LKLNARQSTPRSEISTGPESAVAARCPPLLRLNYCLTAAKPKECATALASVKTDEIMRLTMILAAVMLAKIRFFLVACGIHYLANYRWRMPKESSGITTNAPDSVLKPGKLSDQITQNVEGVLSLQRREWESTSASQRRVEKVSRIIGRPAYLVGILCFAAIWIAVNGKPLGDFTPFDPPPFPLLEGLLTLIALITTTIVLIAQNRQSKVEQQHAHLDLQVNLLTEQKVSKLIRLIEELRHDLPMVKDRLDSHSEVLQETADTSQVLSTIEEVGLTTDRKGQRT
jgi:uncharacterized membrane protein